MGKWDHSGTLLLSALFYQSTPSWLKVRGGKWECAGGHVELLLVPDLGKWDHSEPLLLLTLFLLEHSFMLKNYGVECAGGHVVVAHVILVSAQSFWS